VTENSNDDGFDMVLDLTDKTSPPSAYVPLYVNEHADIYPDYRRNSHSSANRLLNRVVIALAGVFEAIKNTRNAILCILLLIVCIVLWPVGVFLFICFFCWLWKR
jgi:hypothetical protein